MRHPPLTNRARSHTLACPRGFTLIEAVMSMLIVGLMLVAALNTIGASRLSQRQNGELAVGPMLAQSLMSEILTQAYEEPVDTPVVGRESESGGDRVEWDDVDDYDGWSASPPQSKDGTKMSDLTDWGRKVEVKYVDIWDSKKQVGSENGIKRIDVTVTHNNRVVTTLSALRTTGWPEDKAQDALGVLLVVGDSSGPDAQDLARQALMEAWGYSVELIDDGEPIATIDEALGRNDVVYISGTVSPSAANKKFTATTIGVVNENMELGVNMGFGGTDGTNAFDKIADADNTHEITSHLGTGFQTILTSNQDLQGITQNLAPGARTLATAWISGANYKPSLFIIEPGGDLHGGDKAAGRRVQLPWGLSSFDVSGLTDKGRLIMQKSIEWAANVQSP